MAMYSYAPPFREAKFCGVPSRVFDKLGCAASEKRLRNTVLDRLSTHDTKFLQTRPSDILEVKCGIVCW
jgi:hypothetical protein